MECCSCYKRSAACLILLARSTNAPFNCSVSSSVNFVGLPLPSMPFSLW
nr:MAG TPA: hypothetical protein [Caudoviricetes sp.]DAX20138.1 MAG TPA: hypothetical protein [Caudoviricetes sp.]